MVRHPFQSKGWTNENCGTADRTKLDAIYCGYTGFELGRLTNQTLMMVQKSRTPEKYPYVRCGEDSLKQARKKIRKRYSVNVPVNLLLYTETLLAALKATSEKL